MITQASLFGDPIDSISAAITAAGGTPLPLLGPSDVVLVQHKEQVSERSCATSEGWYFVEVTRTVTGAHVAPYKPRKGEKLVSEPHESILYAALNAINERRLREQLAALQEQPYAQPGTSQQPGAARPPCRRRQDRRHGQADRPAA